MTRRQTVRLNDGRHVALTQKIRRIAVPIGNVDPGMLRSRFERTKMATKKNLCEREKELQILLATPTGREHLQELRAQYQEADAGPLRANASVITSILIHERLHGIIVG